MLRQCNGNFGVIIGEIHHVNRRFLLIFLILSWLFNDAINIETTQPRMIELMNDELEGIRKEEIAA
jgi:hypothetical protein